MKKTLLIMLGSCLLFSLSGCSLSLLGSPTPLVLPTPTVVPASPTAALPSATPAPPTATATLVMPAITPGTPNAAATVIPATSGIPSGPYGVILVSSNDVLNVRSGPGVSNTVIGSFPATAINVMRTGPSSTVAGALWVQVQNPSGGTGWVNSFYLSEYVPPVGFCADTSASTLITNLATALRTSNGELLASLVSPVHGMTVHLWLSQPGINFDREHARWIFDSTYVHNWGSHPGSGLVTTGSFHGTVLPKLLDVLNAPAPGYTLGCNSVNVGGASYNTSWPAIYANVNYYSLHKPGPVGNELSWRTILVGVEYVNGQPYVFGLIQLEWEP